MPYVFAHHFSGSGTAEALELYRSQFRPSPELAEPQTFLTVNAAGRGDPGGGGAAGAAAAPRHGRAPHGRAADRAELVEEAEKVDLPDAHRDLMSAMRSRWVIGEPDAARARIEELAATYGVDEVMVHPVAGAHEGADRRSTPGREATLRLLVD